MITPESNSLSNNEITSQGAILLFDTLKKCKAMVRKIDIGRNQLNDKSMKSLGEYVQINPIIEKVIIGDNKITDEGIKILAEFIIGCTTLELIDIQWNRGVTDKSVPYLVDIATNSSVSAMYLEGTTISVSKRGDINAMISAPIQQRGNFIQSSTKSAAKVA